MKKPRIRLQSVCLPRGSDLPVALSESDHSARQELQDEHQSALVKWVPAEVWPGGSNLAAGPFPVIVTKEHERKLATLHEALFLAVTDIVERWWSDDDAQFSKRMPLEPMEEDLLRWMDAQGPEKVRPFKDVTGSWRPDFLLESDPDDPEGVENFRICEINARFCWNGYMLAALGQMALSNMDRGCSHLYGATDPEMVIGGLCRLFDSSLPLYLLKGEESGMDIKLFSFYAKSRLGITPRFIEPADLRLIRCPQSLGGYKLCCVASDSIDLPNQSPILKNSNGERLEEIHQVGLELHQRELPGLGPEMLQQISLRCFNDMRAVLLVHDKRMLGIVLQELDNLVARGILSRSQAKVLKKGIAPTTLPGSDEMEHFIRRCAEGETVKDEYILKPVRSGKGAGILFGDQLSHTEWLSKLLPLRCSQLDPERTTYVIQRSIQQLQYDVLLREEEGIKRYPMIGTYQAVHGQFLGFGVWRSGPGRVCAVSHGGAWFCSVMENA